jgi:hypothetical protein
VIGLWPAGTFGEPLDRFPPCGLRGHRQKDRFQFYRLVLSLRRGANNGRLSTVVSWGFVMTFKPRAVGVAWFRREDYQRIRDISDDEMQPTFDDFEAKMAKHLPRFETPDVIIEKVIIDPDELLAFAREFHGGKIDSKVRGEFAARRVAEKYGSNH